ncbi:MAG TPA: hypothetical protein VK993_01100 [Chthoniobacterales bacterium]|nr:hypothetical protein [Chthoniobacterales bacterium]
MAAPDTIVLAARGAEEGLDAVLVGGNAVNLHAYSRTTFDVDLLVPEHQAEGWLAFFERHGYAVFHRTPNFIRARLVDDPAGALPLDLMLADAETFSKIQQGSLPCDLGDGLSLRIPSALHLIAMKLHALRSPHRLAHGADVQDVKHLIRTAKIDISSPEFAEVMERYGSDTIRERIIRELS